MALADTAARRLLRGAGGGMARGIAGEAVSMSFGLDGLWQLIAGLFAGAAHLLVLPFQVLGHWLMAAIAAVAHLVALPFEALWHLLQSAAAGVGLCFNNIVAAIGSVPHALAVPFEALWHLVQSAAAGVGLCFNNIVAALGSVPHALAVPFEALWHLVQSAAAGVGLCFNNIVASLGSVPHALAVPFEAVWRWLKDAFAVALPVVLAIAAVACVAALVWFFWPPLSIAVAQSLVCVLCFCGRCLYAVAMGVWGALAWLVPCCGQYCARATMAAPGAAGAVISRAAFMANPQLYFQILRSAGPVVASAVYCTGTIASAVGAPVAALFRP